MMIKFKATDHQIQRDSGNVNIAATVTDSTARALAHAILDELGEPVHQSQSECGHLVVDKFGRCENCFVLVGGEK